MLESVTRLPEPDMVVQEAALESQCHLEQVGRERHLSEQSPQLHVMYL